MGKLIRSIDWSKTPLGSAEEWPQSLKTCIRIVLTSRQPMFVWWGEHLINIYNDAYIDIVRGKHPESFGAPAKEVWREIWDQVGPRAETAMRKNEGTYDEALLLIMERNGYPEETYYTFSYSPIPGDQGEPEGIICANTDDTQRIIGERQLRTLKDLGKSLTNTLTEQEVYESVLRIFQENPQDFPFAFIYQIQGQESSAQLAGKSADLSDDIVLPHLAAEALATSPWQLEQAIHSSKIEIITDLLHTFGNLPSGAWKQSPDRALLIPITYGGQKLAASVMVVGLNPYRLLDDKYLSFFQLIADQVSTSLGNIHAYEQERKRAEALAELDRAKTTFFSNVSHEFRTPLTLMLGPLEEVIREASSNLQSTQQENLEIAHRNALRLLKLVNNLLDFSRIEANRMQASYEALDLATLTKDLASNFRSAIEKAGMQLEIDCEPLQEPVYVDREMWEKIVFNLLSNAFKFTLEGSIKVQLRQENEHAVLSIQDTGVGIPASEIEHIFQRFHRVQNMQGRTYEGTGIGLSLVQELVKLHGGHIEVQSQPDIGSTFTVSIPLGKAHLQAAHLLTPTTTPAKATGTQLYLEEALRWLPNGQSELEELNLLEFSEPQTVQATSKKPMILLADDNADMRDYVQKLLRPHFEVETVNDGYQVLQSLQHKTPDLILSDIMMPHMDGIELLKHLKQHPQTALTPVILLSARAGEAARLDGLEAGADDYLVKPFSAKELLTRVSNHLRIASARLQAHKQLHNIFRQAPVAMCILRGPDYIIELANEKALQVWGKTAAQVLEKKALEVFPELAEQGWKQIFDDVFLTNKSFSLQNHSFQLFRHSKLETVYINFTYEPLHNIDGSMYGIMALGVEVTDQVLARQKAEESERRYQHLITDSPVAIAILKGVDMTISVANDAILETWGKGQEVIGKSLLSIMPEVVEQGFGDLLNYVFTTGNSYYGHEAKVLLQRHGQWEDVYYNFVYQPQYESDGSISGVVIIATEVTPQAIAKQKIAASEQQLRNMIMQAPVGIAILRGPDHVFEIINDDYRQLVDKSTMELIGMPLLKALPELATQPIKGLLDTVVNTGEPYYGNEYPVILNRFGNAATAYFNFVYQPLRESDGTISGVMVVANEVTEQVLARHRVEESENRYRTLFESMDEGFCVVEVIFDSKNHSVDYRFLEINPTFEKQTGLKEALGKTARELVPDLEDYWFETYGKVALTGEPARFTSDSQVLNRWFDVYAYRIGGIASHKVGILFSDVTEHKKAEEALRKSHQFNQDVLDSLAEHLAVVNKNGFITAINEAWRRFAIQNGADWTMKDVGVGVNYLDVCKIEHDPEAMMIYEGIKDVLYGKREFFSMEYPCHSPTSERWFLLTASPLTHGDGGAVISHLNVTNRRKAEEALRENEDRLRIAIDSAELGTWDYNPGTGDLIWDKRSKALFGLPVSEKVSYDMFTQGLHPDDRSRVEEAVNAALRREKNGIFDIEYRAIGFEDQRLRWIRAKGKAFFDWEGNPTRFIGSMLDITKAKWYEMYLEDSEASFRKLADNVPIKIWVTQADGYCTYLNRQWFVYTGQTEEEALGFGWLKAVHPEDAEQAHTKFLDANEKRTRFHLEYRLRGKDGVYRWRLDAGVPRFNEDGEFEGFIGSVVDIHDRKLAEEQKDAFMRIAGHELRTPLTSLVGYLSLMLKAPDNTAAVANYAKKGYESALKMRSLITDFLDFSKVQQGELTFTIGEVDFDSLVADTVYNMQMSFPQHRILLEGKTEKKIYGDRGRIEQVLTNLLNNAIKYSPGKDQIDVTIRSTQNSVVLQVEDYGLGIEKRELNRIFTKFHRANNTGKIKGMGLGLYIVKEIVDFHQGKISVESTPGEGTIFTIELPASSQALLKN